jgi:hypothetical protein
VQRQERSSARITKQSAIDPSPVLSLPTITADELYDSWTLERRAEEHQRDIACAMKWYSHPMVTYSGG